MSKYSRVRLKPEERKRMILNAALDDAIENGPYHISMISVSRRLDNTSKGTIKHYFPTLSELRDAVIAEAVESSCDTVIGAAVAMRHESFKEEDRPISEEQKNDCLKKYISQG